MVVLDPVCRDEELYLEAKLSPRTYHHFIQKNLSCVFISTICNNVCKVRTFFSLKNITRRASLFNLSAFKEYRSEYVQRGPSKGGRIEFTSDMLCG